MSHYRWPKELSNLRPAMAGGAQSREVGTKHGGEARGGVLQLRSC